MVDNPSFLNTEYTLMAGDVKTCRDLNNGQNALRNDTYLPKFDGESSNGYETRKSLSYLNNKFNEKIKTSIGLILGRDIEVAEEVDYIQNNIDGQGSTIDQFAINVLKNGEIDGHSFILVDAPSTVANSLQEQDELNINPYWVNVPMSNVLNWKSENGILTQCTIVENVAEDVGRFETVNITQYKVFTLFEGSVYYEIYRMDGNQLSLYLEATQLAFTEIPLIPFYTNQISFMMSTPPYMNVANNNINTFQLGSQKQRALKIVGDPDKAIFDDAILHSLQSAQLDDGGVKETTLTFGADIAQVFSTDAKYMYVEPTGKGVEMLGAEIDRVEKFIDGIGAELATTADMTATEAEITNTKATSSDVIFSKNLEDALNRAYMVTTQIDTSLANNENMFTLDRGFARQTLDATMIGVLNTSVLSGNMSKRTYLESIGTGTLPKFSTEDEVNEELLLITNESVGV